MKTKLAMTMLAAALLPAASPAQIVKHANTPPALILQGVTVPAGAETLYLSGQLASPIDPTKKSSDIKSFEDLGDTKTQTISTLNKIKGILASKGYTMADIIKMTVFVAAAPGFDGKMDFKGMNEGFSQFFNTAENPTTVARSTVQVANLAGPYFLVEIEVTAAKTPSKKK
ncbi:endonuclease [Sphingomonas oleivorans]|uniref:Endonuclease n=1 Tax=Sphingomonas oleivorans TaxID=1735121 RepID=A0A2T5FU31_9SPHN|nr:RidA family protein [Sphingomonas oleivorans]PTQ07783.1 endonuclease [Sphingomonas oleivorans]